MTAETYRCESCGNTFEKIRPDADAMAELALEFGKVTDAAIVCEDCWVAIMSSAEAAGVQRPGWRERAFNNG